MLDILAPHVLETRTEQARRFRTASPFPHLVIDQFFTDDFARRLLAEFPPFDRGNSMNENGVRGGKATVEALSSLGEAFRLADLAFRAPEFTALVSDLTGIPDLLYDPDYIGGGTHENLSGQELDPHVDFNYHPIRGWHRRLNLIVYLNPEWEEGWGGALELHEDPWLPPEQNGIRRVLPLLNRAVIFETSERSWHGFEAVKVPPHKPGLSRKSLAIYLYTRDRPAAETAPSHSTVYVERPLPFVLRPGQMLTKPQKERLQNALNRRKLHAERLIRRDIEFTTLVNQLVGDLVASNAELDGDDVQLLGRLVGCSDALLRTLYDREKQLSQQIALLRQLTNREGHWPFPLTGSARLAAKPEGYHSHDHWVGPHLALELLARAELTSLTVVGLIPDHVTHELTLTIGIDGEDQVRTFASGHFTWDVPLAVPAGARATIVLTASKSICPARDVDGSTDDRELSFLLSSVDLR